MAIIQTAESSTQRLNNHFDKARQLLRDNELKKQAIIRNLAYSIEQQGLLPCDFICEEIVSALRGQLYGVGPQYIRKCLDKRYKRKYKKNIVEENTPGFAIHEKKVTEDEVPTSLLMTSKEVELAIQLLTVNSWKEELEQERKKLMRQNVRLKQENQEIRANRDRLENHLRELQLQLTHPCHIKVPTNIWEPLQSMASSNTKNANIIVENGVFARLESEQDNADL